MTLYGYWRSSASYRVRIALNLKGIEVRHRSVDLKAGDQLGNAYTQMNPQALVPLLELEDGTRLSQSLAILDYLEETYPQPPILPASPAERAQVRAAAQVIAADTAPLQNLRVLNHMRSTYSQDNAAVKAWAAHWITKGLSTLETTMHHNNHAFYLSDTPGYFECFLIPQMYNARRFGADLAPMPKLQAIRDAALAHPAFQAAAPERQADAANL